MEAFGDARSALDDLKAQQAEILAFGDGSPGTGSGLRTAAQIGQWLAGAGFGRVLSCQAQLSNEQMFANQEQILRNQEAPLAHPAFNSSR